ncbi:MAG: hypothetical protein IJR83_06915 [Clostridia bacterium]|nr:hypothetical protein [Clostridia bacterium]
MTVKRGALLTTREIVIYALLGSLMFCSKLLMEWAPNVHFLGMFTIVYTLVYRRRALFPIYVFVFLIFAYSGFSLWSVPYLYLWTILWGVTMLLPKNMKPGIAIPVYAVVCSLHGLLYGTLYAPFQAIAFHYSLQATFAWIAAGLPYDAVHALGNLCAGLLIVPVATLLLRLEKKPLPRWAIKKKATPSGDGSQSEPDQSSADQDDT